MRCIQDQSSITTPFIVHFSTKKESPLAVGPSIIMEYIDHHITMYDLLNTPGIPKSKRGIVDPKICELKLKALYGQLGDVLKLSRLYLLR